MKNIQRLETKYLQAKIAYYEGNPIMSDSEFDSLEQILIKEGSKVHEQVGSKRKDFDFAHPTKMLSLSKYQTEKTELGTNYVETEFISWYDKRILQLGTSYTSLFSSPKFDGSAINIIYKGTELFQVLTRGDGFSGKDVTKRFTPHIPNILDCNVQLDETDTIEIRCEVVINKNLFKEKYSQEFANPRNYVAGVIGKDDYDKMKVSELTIIPLHFLRNGIQVYHSLFRGGIYSNNCNEEFSPNGYIDMIKKYEKMRDDFEFQLDGVVIAFPESFRKELGENDHDPNWAIAIKFVPEGAVTTVNGIEWNVSKRGELCPVVLLEPVALDGTTVKRASGYNAGYLKTNKIGKGAVVSIAKAGDIIPEIQKVILESNMSQTFPVFCPNCGTALEFDGIHLMCNNEDCIGRIAKKLATGAGVLDLKGIGSERLKPFAVDFPNIYELWKWVLLSGETKEIEKYGIKHGERLHEIFVDAFKNIKSIPYEKVVQLLGYDNVGRKITQQLAKEHAGLDFNYASLERALVEKLHTPDVEKYIKKAVNTLESLGVTIDRPEALKTDLNLFGVILTGSPKAFGYKTKAEFLDKFPNLFECSMSDKECKYLITDDLNSTSGKMKQAKKKGIEIKTYGEF